MQSITSKTFFEQHFNLGLIVLLKEFIQKVNRCRILNNSIISKFCQFSGFGNGIINISQLIYQLILDSSNTTPNTTLSNLINIT